MLIIYLHDNLSYFIQSTSINPIKNLSFITHLIIQASCEAWETFIPWPRPWPVRWAHPTQPPWPDHRRCGPRCGSLLHPLDDKKAILIIPCHLLSMFPFVLHWFTMFYPILAPCPSHALYPCHSSTLEAPKSVASHDVTRYELPQVPWVPAKFPPGSHRAPRPRYIPRS